MKTFKKILLKTLKFLGVFLLFLLIAAGIVYYNSVNYSMPSLHTKEVASTALTSDTDFKKLAKELVAQMTLKEKVKQMYGEKYAGGLAKMLINFLGRGRFPHIYVGENERLGIPPWVLSDGPRGARVRDKSVEGVTTFPVAMARGASWNIELEQQIHEVIASEIRANQVNYAATPCINLLRHPGWGRAQETYGEDPWLLGEFGVAAVKGIEKHKVMACPKHFALNSIENSRWVIDITVDDRTLHEVYLPHFKKTVQEGKPASIMSAYNAVNGEFCGSNKRLLTDILRDDWGFDGFVTTDWFYGLYDGIGGVKAGLNVEMPVRQAYNYEAIEKGIQNGEISEADIDTLVVQSLATRLKYAFVDDQGQYPQDIIGQPSSIDLARIAAEEGMVLLKNENVLPFKKESGKTIAVIGRLANLENTGDHGSSDSTPIYVTTPFEGIKTHQEALGNTVILNDGSDVASAKALAQRADEVILLVGFTHEDEGEFIVWKRETMEASAEAGKFLGDTKIGGDRENLRLNQPDEALIKALSPTNQNLAVVYVGGSAIDLSPWENEVPAILFSWYSGMEGGTALAHILYGDVNPSGKLPFSIAKDQKDYPEFKPFTKKATYDYYHGYTLFDKKNIDPAYPFGFGKSYSNFAYDSLSVVKNEIGLDDLLEVEVQVTNTSTIAGKEVIQLYVGFSNSEVDRPIKLLRDFKKILLEPNETKKVKLEVSVKDLAWYNPENEGWEIEIMDYELYVGSSSREKDLLKTTFTVNKKNAGFR
ncbi:beta-glucosidase [Flagellimonas allohymeniacidonis]|uniref:Glycosyl hydrolase n=1 Tax=Flagellimonas allohymeniacidonis TaxID=2517819 RepID=A0A4Q8QGM4_9FLAO|nr:glycoside hydrolase family 3 C-terminal domain-containing protein [Allomuricauda hymeniacidonis]TAI47743.1 glycosyl hydrolase [Allomuricauda hymeniacidonis]